MFSKRKKGLAVDFPQRDPEVLKLKAELDGLHEEMGRLSGEISRKRARLDELASAEAAGGAPTRDVRLKLAAEVDAAGLALREARSRVRQLVNDAIPAARDRACIRIAATHRDEFNKATATFVKSQIERLAVEICAAAHVRQCVTSFEGLRINRRGMPMAHSINRAAGDFDQLKEDAEALIAAGVISKSDLPKDVAAVWGI